MMPASHADAGWSPVRSGRRSNASSTAAYSFAAKAELLAREDLLLGEKLLDGLCVIRIGRAGIDRTDRGALLLVVVALAFRALIGVDDVNRVPFAYRAVGAY